MLDCTAGFLTLQLQQSALKLSEAMWTAKSTSNGFSVSFFWPCHGVSSKQPCIRSEKPKKRQKKRKVKAKSCSPSEAKCNTQAKGMETSPANVLVEAHHGPENVRSEVKDGIDLKSCTNIA